MAHRSTSFPMRSAGKVKFGGRKNWLRCAVWYRSWTAWLELLPRGISIRSLPEFPNETGRMSRLAEQDRKENTPKTFNGKEYTLYEAKQRQRQMETAMRAQREKVKLLDSGGADPDDVMLARAKYQGQLNEYSRFCKKMGLTEERERIYYDMRGRVATKIRRCRICGIVLI